MFVAKFSQTTGAPFVSDKNGNMPFIGEVLAGKATGTLINGTMFQRDGLQPNKLYACENFTDPEYPTNTQVRVVSEVSIVEFLSLRTVLGAPSVSVGTPEAEPVTDEAESAEAGLV